MAADAPRAMSGLARTLGVREVEGAASAELLPLGYEALRQLATSLARLAPDCTAGGELTCDDRVPGRRPPASSASAEGVQLSNPVCTLRPTRIPHRLAVWFSLRFPTRLGRSPGFSTR